MNRIVFLILLFLFIVYVYSFMKIRKKKKQRDNELTFVEQYHMNQKRSSSLRKDATNVYSKNADEIRNYITKYNSSVDYIERTLQSNESKKQE